MVTDRSPSNFANRDANAGQPRHPRDLNSESVDLVDADPPFNISMERENGMEDRDNLHPARAGTGDYLRQLDGRLSVDQARRYTNVAPRRIVGRPAPPRGPDLGSEAITAQEPRD